MTGQTTSNTTDRPTTPAAGQTPMPVVNAGRGTGLEGVSAPTDRAATIISGGLEVKVVTAIDVGTDRAPADKLILVVPPGMENDTRVVKAAADAATTSIRTGGLPVATATAA